MAIFLGDLCSRVGNRVQVGVQTTERASIVVKIDDRLNDFHFEREIGIIELIQNKFEDIIIDDIVATWHAKLGEHLDVK